MGSGLTVHRVPDRDGGVVVQHPPYPGRMPRPLRPAPEPLDVNATTVITAGTAVWFVAFIVLLFFTGQLADAGHLVWLWTALAGWLLGLLGLWIAVRQQRRR